MVYAEAQKLDTLIVAVLFKDAYKTKMSDDYH